MRHSILSLAIALFLISNACAQSAPKPPKTPSTGTSYSIDFDYDNDGSNSSVTIKRNENLYKLSASFDKYRTAEIKEILLKNLDQKDLQVKGSTYTWIKNKKGEEIFECKLTKGKLRIFVDKEYASEIFVTEISNFGDELKDIISGSDSKKQAKEDAERELQRAEKALEMAKREVEKMKRKIKN